MSISKSFLCTSFLLLGQHVFGRSNLELEIIQICNIRNDDKSIDGIKYDQYVRTLLVRVELHDGDSDYPLPFDELHNGASP